MIQRQRSFLLLVLEPDGQELTGRAAGPELEKAGLEVELVQATGEDDFRAALERKPDVIVADDDLPGFAASEALSLLQKEKRSIPLIVLSGTLDDQAARKCVDLGAVDYLLKDRLARLGPAILNAYRQERLRVEKEEASRDCREAIALAEINFRKSESRFQAVWRYSYVAMRLTNREGVIQAVNEAYCRLVNMAEKELVGQLFSVVYPDGDPLEWKQKHIERFDSRIPVLQDQSRKRFVNRDRDLDVEVTINRVAVDGGEDLLLTMIRDVSEKKELEARFLRTQRMECIGALAGGVAHDFNNILAPIFMASSMLRMKIDAADREKALAAVEGSAQRGADVVRRLLLFARGIEGEKEPLNPADLLREVAGIIERSFPRNIRLEVNVQPGLQSVNGDGTQLHQVLLNLCLNARDAMSDGGTLTLEAANRDLHVDNLPKSPLARTGSYVVVSIIDTGVGIPRSDINRIFEPFFTTKAAQDGTGLGLSTSLGIIQSHGGFLTVSSEEGKGSRFDVYLPVSTAGEAAKVVERREESETIGGSDQLILVVDDEKLVLEVTSKVLRKCGYRTLLATSAAEALAKLPGNEEELDAIVTDLMMPEMDGLQLVRKIRETHPRVPVIAMSGNVDQAYLGELADVGVTEIIDKPFRADQLLKVIRRLLGTPPSSENEKERARP